MRKPWEQSLQGFRRRPGADDAAVVPARGGAAMSFGAVYEYRDSAGAPRFVAGTANRPEEAWRDDRAREPRVRALADAGGSASVVWAGVGRGPCGHAEMAAARDAVVRDRSERQRIGELGSAKPYSRHAHMLL